MLSCKDADRSARLCRVEGRGGLSGENLNGRSQCLAGESPRQELAVIRQHASWHGKEWWAHTKTRRHEDGKRLETLRRESFVASYLCARKSQANDGRV